MEFILYYVGIGLVLSLPLISVVEITDEVEVVLTIFGWPYLWILLVKMFVKFVIKELCTKTE